MTDHSDQTTTTPEAHLIASGSSAETPEITVWEKPVRGRQNIVFSTYRYYRSKERNAVSKMT
jgi:hypothetical protein